MPSRTAIAMRSPAMIFVKLFVMLI